MKHRPILVTVAIIPVVMLLACAACSRSPGVYRTEPAVVPPSEVVDFKQIYGQNCAGCHGVDGKGGAAIALANPVFLAIADDTVIRRICLKRRPRDADARLCTECRGDAHRQTDRRDCARNSILAETRCSPRRNSTALYSPGSRRSETWRRRISDLLLLLSRSRRPWREQGQLDC